MFRFRQILSLMKLSRRKRCQRRKSKKFKSSGSGSGSVRRDGQTIVAPLGGRPNDEAVTTRTKMTTTLAGPMLDRLRNGMGRNAPLRTIDTSSYLVGDDQGQAANSWTPAPEGP